LVYADVINLLSGNINSTKKVTESPLDTNLDADINTYMEKLYIKT